MKKFKLLDDVEILGTDGVVGFIGCAATFSGGYVVCLYDKDIQAVYPYKGNTRTYPAYMLTLVE